MLGINRNPRPPHAPVGLRARRRQLRALIELAESCEGGVFKRIAELRETASALRREAPSLAEANPWLLWWLGSTDEFLCALADALHPLDLSRHRGGVPARGGVFPTPELGPPEVLYGTIHRLRDLSPPRFWRRGSAADYTPIQDQHRAIEDYQVPRSGAEHDVVSLPTLGGLAQHVPDAADTSTAAPHASGDAP